MNRLGNIAIVTIYCLLLLLIGYYSGIARTERNIMKKQEEIFQKNRDELQAFSRLFRGEKGFLAVCPYCEKRVRINTNAYDIFDCPHCEKMFKLPTQQVKKFERFLWLNYKRENMNLVYETSVK